MSDPLFEGRETRFGSGWISGVLSATLGAMGLGAVLCLLFPAILTTPELREIYPMDWVRSLIQLVLVAAFVLGIISVILRKWMFLGVSGICLSVLATLMGGSKAPVEGPVSKSNYLGLDWFLLNLLFLALIFVPMERLFARLKDQGIFRQGWSTDLAHFFVSHLLVQVTVLLTMMPATVFFRWAIYPGFQRAVASQPAVLQFCEILFVADFAEYVVHRLFHTVPFLWRFHAIHHSCERLDWLASSRLHLVDVVVTRGLTFVPLFVLGFATAPVYFYLVFVSFHAIFIHANVRFDFGPLAWVFATPRFHHWHHSAQQEAVNKNFAVHLPVIDMFFGTLHLPEREWPATYGIEGHPVPESYLRQLIFPFRRQKRAAAS